MCIKWDVKLCKLAHRFHVKLLEQWVVRFTCIIHPTIEMFRVNYWQVDNFINTQSTLSMDKGVYPPEAMGHLHLAFFHSHPSSPSSFLLLPSLVSFQSPSFLTSSSTSLTFAPLPPILATEWHPKSSCGSGEHLELTMGLGGAHRQTILVHFK